MRYFVSENLNTTPPLTTPLESSSLSNSLACRCREKALGKFKYFSLGFYGECWGANAEDFRALHIPTSVGTCINGDMNNCGNKRGKHECTGIEDNEYIYKVIAGKDNSYMGVQVTFGGLQYILE